MKREALAESYEIHIKRAICVWEQTINGKWYSRPVTKKDIKHWRDLAAKYRGE